MDTYQITCPGCHGQFQGAPVLAGADVVCPSCRLQFKAPTLLTPIPAPDAASQVRGFAGKLVGHITHLAGEDGLEGFNVKQLFSEVFSRHTSQEVEDYFTVGTSRTTPGLDAVDPSWPRPWVFFRTFVGALLVYLGFLLAWNQFNNMNLIPGLIMVGSFAVPLAMLIFFFEINVRQNVSLYQVVRLTFAGGVLALVLTCVLYSVTDALNVQWLGALIPGLAEEPGKLLGLLLIVNSLRHRHILNGLLFGAAIGAGFAAFESAGYALRSGLQDSDTMMKHTIMIRGLLAPFGHIAWTAMCAAALWKVMGTARFQFSMLKDHRFLRIFAFAVALHALWDCSLDLPFYGKYLLLGLVAWIIILALIQDGLKQLRREKEAAAAAPPATAPVAAPNS